MPARLNLLGTMVFERQDGVVVDAGAVPTVKALDLLRLLVGARGWTCADHYVGQLWPAADTGRGRGSLRTAMAQLRKVLGPEVLSRSGDLIALGEVGSDVGRLRELSEQADHAWHSGQCLEVVTLVREAMETCGGDLVVSGSSCDAVYELRDELRGLRHRMLLDGAAAAARLGWMRESLEMAHLADGLGRTEASARALMVAHSGLGETRLAIDTFERLREQLADDYGVQPSPRSRALYLQVVTAGEQQRCTPAEHHADLVEEVARVIRFLGAGPAASGIVWLLGEPGSGRGTVARQAARLAESAFGRTSAAVEVLPEIVDVDALEAQRLRREAREDQCVLVVPIRSEINDAVRGGDVVVEVGRLGRVEFRALLSQLLQDRAAPPLEARLWTTSGGLAGRLCRTVRRLVQDGELAWTPDGVDVAVRGATRRLTRRQRVGTGVRAMFAPVLVDLGGFLSSAESALLPVLAA
ncbi:BTAD domain-containing putative transcriptional regulator [Nocardioides sp. YIM 152315]|uniref:AfsR/SARP family transcriptional regulator n=1 Tax=Nocardioides sp. YIM 152315 TaxID=3031760 RepID=UPI0023DBDC5A|nr:BTAD domain-containing putative transcriptional regulator [Nocardioides sp. YIM 152315]MDF1605623.1 BTAD domain-containing putative transcriptional regulator [Nocardioides sp. YIM 152315]